MKILASLRAAAPPTAVTAGLITVLVGVTSTAAIVFTAARTAGADPAEVASWMFAVCAGAGVTAIGLSLRYRTPVVTAWSTPGAALLTTGLTGVPMGRAVGAFVFSGVLITLSGVTGWFARAMKSIPVPLASALLAGVLLEFGTGLFRSMHGHGFGVAFPMFAAYLVARRALPRYAVLLALATGVVATSVTGGWRHGGAGLALAAPVFVTPAFDWRTLVSVGLPLYVVTMASQNLPGVAVLRASGYDVPVSPLVGWTGAANTVLAPFGAFGLNLAAITAAICTGEQAHPDKNRRYLAAVWAGVFYLCVAAFGGTIGAVLAAMPPSLVLGIAGIGLLATIGSSLQSALAQEATREAAVVTFLATASGLTLLGIGPAFWGLLAGVLTMAVARTRFTPFRRGPSSRGRAEAAPAAAGRAEAAVPAPGGPGPRGAGDGTLPAGSGGGPVSAADPR